MGDQRRRICFHGLMDMKNKIEKKNERLLLIKGNIKIDNYMGSTVINYK